MKISLSLAAAILVALVSSALAAETSADRQTAPNVVFIIADDLGIGDLQCYGNPYVDTPVLNALAAEGIRFTDHYAPSPLCAPSRAGYLTGRFNHRTGAVDVPSNRGLDRIALSELTFGDYFREAGYATALIGKWHNGLYCRDYLPHRRGFDRYFGFPNGGQDYWKWNLLRNDKRVAHDGRYLTDALTDEAIRFIRDSNADGKPFALFLSHAAPHPPFQAPPKLLAKYRQRLGEGASENVAAIYAMIESMDRGLGRLFRTLKKEGLWERTVIVFTSDNGAFLGRAQGGSTARYHASFSGNKGDVGEQGIRVPAIVAWPGTFPGGRIVRTPVHGCDWLPTLFGLTGKPAPKNAQRFDGKNLMPLMLGQPQPALKQRELPFQKNRYRPAAHSDAAIRRGRWKLLWPGAAVTMRKDSARDNPSYYRGLVMPHWEMPLDRELADVPMFEEPRPRLFDLAVDPAERHDVSALHPELAAELSANYDQWFANVMTDWRRARGAIVEHDRQYWQDRTPPDPAVLFKDYWLWSKAPAGVKAGVADPLTVFRGYWNDPAR